MTTRDVRREEFSSSNIVRSARPSRPLSPPQKNTEFDNNLDYLLDDLQTSVSRTAQHLNASKKRDVQYLSPSNSTTVVQERSVSPGDGRKLYKTSRYEYSTSRSGSGTNLQPQKYDSTQANVNQLDNLLEDLKQERERERDVTFDKENNFSNIGIDSGLLEPSSRINKSTRTRTTSTGSGVSKPTVNRELNFDSPSLVSSVMHESRSRQRSRSPNFQRHLESQIVRDIGYDSEPILDSTPNSTIRRSYNYSKTNKQTVPSYNTDIIEVETSALPAELKDVPLSNDLLPGPGTKVTTTIKTFTYEIPDDTNVPANKNFIYKNEFYNTLNSSTSANSVYPERDIPTPQRLSAGRSPGPNQTYIYKNETHNTLNRSDGGYRPPSTGPTYSEPGTNQTYIYKREINETKNNVYAPLPTGQTILPPRSLSPQLRPISPVKSTVFYERNETNTTNRNQYHPPGGIPVYPINGTLSPSTRPVSPGTKQTYLYKKETSNTSNTMYGPPVNEYPPRDRIVPVNSSPYTSSPIEPTSNIYKYTSETTTRNVHNRPLEREPLLTRSPFPNNQEPSQVDGASPKHLGQLLATFDDSKKDFEPYVPRKEVNTALATNKNIPIVEPKVPTKNIAGPAVYYPPGQELFTKSDAQAAWRAQGGYAKGSGKYEYEAESKSKKSSKSGAAVVPVCLPLCCAMPCTIM